MPATSPTSIIAARLPGQLQVQDAIHALQAAGFAPGKLCAFYVNPPGQHNLYPGGGDADRSPGAEDTGSGTLRGIAAGATVGIVAVPVLGAIGPFLGAYIGALVGSMVTTRELREMVHPETPAEHPSGMLLAVETQNAAEREQAIAVLLDAGGYELEEAEGEIEGGEWSGFDPRQPPRLLPAPAMQQARR